MKWSPFLPQLQAGQSVVATVELMTPHYLLVALNTLSGSLLAYAATDSVSGGTTSPRLPPFVAFTLLFFPLSSSVQGQLEVPNASYSHIKIGQKVTVNVHRYCVSIFYDVMMTSLLSSPASESFGKRNGPPIVVVTGTRVSGSKESRGTAPRPSYMNVKPGDIIDVM